MNMTRFHDDETLVWARGPERRTPRGNRIERMLETLCHSYFTNTCCKRRHRRNGLRDFFCSIQRGVPG